MQEPNVHFKFTKSNILSRAHGRAGASPRGQQLVVGLELKFVVSNPGLPSLHQRLVLQLIPRKHDDGENHRLETGQWRGQFGHSVGLCL